MAAWVSGLARCGLWPRAAGVDVTQRQVGSYLKQNSSHMVYLPQRKTKAITVFRRSKPLQTITVDLSALPRQKATQGGGRPTAVRSAEFALCCACAQHGCALAPTARDRRHEAASRAREHVPRIAECTWRRFSTHMSKHSAKLEPQRTGLEKTGWFQ